MSKVLDRERPALRDAVKQTKKGPVDKHAVNIKAAEGDEGAVGVMEPSSDQLAKINQFTRTPKKASDVVVFETFSCNDLVDRDDEKFRSACVNKFAALEAPYSSVGKSFMLSHDYTKLPVGRIFDVGTKRKEGINFVTNQVYIPNTETNKSFIENVDHGIYWAVSVGVVIETAECSICRHQMYNGWFGAFCDQGHEKGMYYDPKSEEKDEYGYAVPADPSSKNAVKCVTEFDDPKDYYELSMVFLGAQYMAELGKQANFKGVVKAATAGKLPIIGLSAKEAKELPLQLWPEKVAEAHKTYEVTEEDDGSMTWKDTDGLVWTYESGDEDASCLGKAVDEDEEDSSDEDTDDGDENTDIDGDEDEDTDDEDESDEDDQDEDGETLMADAKTTINSALRTVKWPRVLVDAVKGASGDDLPSVLTAIGDLVKERQSKIEALEPKAAAGDKWLKTLRAEVISWYVKSTATKEEPKVKVTHLEKMLDRIDDDPDIMLQLISDYKSVAQARFPAETRRSSFESDANSATPPASFGADGNGDAHTPDPVVSRIHS